MLAGHCVKKSTVKQLSSPGVLAAQFLELATGIREIVGSIPSFPTPKKRGLRKERFPFY